MADDTIPEQPKTTQLPAVPQWAIELTQAMKDGFRTTDANFRTTNANIDTVTNELGVVKERLAVGEARINTLETERAKLSGGVRQLSSSNAEQDSQLAQERSAREALAAKVDVIGASQQVQLAIMERLDKVASNPTVKVLGGMLLTALVTWLASKGLVVR